MNSASKSFFDLTIKELTSINDAYEGLIQSVAEAESRFSGTLGVLQKQHRDVQSLLLDLLLDERTHRDSVSFK